VNEWVWFLLLGVAFSVWYVFRPPAVFVVRIRHGQPEATQGTVTAAFLEIVRQLCAEHGLLSAEVRGLARGRWVSLWFTRGVPRTFRQQLRNWWGMHGWLAPRIRPRT
jgi:hypothetical protein